MAWCETCYKSDDQKQIVAFLCSPKGQSGRPMCTCPCGHRSHGTNTLAELARQEPVPRGLVG